MLLDLKIYNGKMSLEFDKYVNIYTISIEDDINSLNIDYKTLENEEVKIIGNENFEYGLNYVYLEVINNESKNIYTLEVYKENEVVAMNTKEDIPSTSNNQKNTYYPYVIFFTCLIITLINFYLLFLRKKTKKNF